MAKILVAGLNPAWQKVLSLPSLQLGSVNRARESWTLASGKGINAAKVLARLGHEVSLLQILAGENGQRCLADCESWKIRSLHVWTQGETRECITLLSETGPATEIIEPFSVTEANIAQDLLLQIKNDPTYDAVVICGTLPPGIPESLYADILNIVPASLVIWDSVMGLTPELLKRISWIKLNAEEFAKFPASENSQSSVLITDGPNGARVLHSNAADGQYALPLFNGIRNPIGAGDTVTAALTDGIIRRLDTEASVKRALAFGSASCLSPLPAEFDPAEAAALESQIRKEKS